MQVGEILGLHHIKIPVSDLPRSRSWYERVFDLEPLMEFRDDEDGVVRGVSYHSKGELALSLRENVPAAAGSPASIPSRSRCAADPTSSIGQDASMNSASPTPR